MRADAVSRVNQESISVMGKTTHFPYNVLGVVANTCNPKHSETEARRLL